MCRILLFSGTCPRCKNTFTWDELSQELPCLEAKNIGLFGQCRHGVLPEQHEHEQECDACAALTEGAEGAGEMDFGWIAEGEIVKYGGGTATRGGSSHGESARREEKIPEEDSDGRKKKKRRV
jgi:hypothetical protein